MNSEPQKPLILRVSAVYIVLGDEETEPEDKRWKTVKRRGIKKPTTHLC